MRVIPSIALLLLAGSCARDPTALSLTEEQLMVHSVLREGADTVHVLVTLTLPDPFESPEVIGGFTYTKPVSGAEVRIRYGETAVTLTEAPEGFAPCVSTFFFAVARVEEIGPGCYAAVLPDPVSSERSYRLEVNAPGAVVTGLTTVVPPPEILFPQAGARIRFRASPEFSEDPPIAFPIRYRVSEAVAGVREALRVQRIFSGGAEITDARCQVGTDPPEVRRTERVDSTQIVATAIFCTRLIDEQRSEIVVPDSIYALVVLASHDSAYVTFSEAASQQSAERERLRAQVEGALGLFTGAGVAYQPIVLVAE